LVNLAPKQEIDEGWEQIKIAIVDAAREVIQKQGKLPRNEWWMNNAGKSVNKKMKPGKNGYN
jgi:hypothetical protein